MARNRGSPPADRAATHAGIPDAPLPDRQAVIDYVRDQGDGSGGGLTRRDLAKAFGIKGTEQRAAFRRLINELKDEGALGGPSEAAQRRDGVLPPVTVLEVTGLSADGEPLARPTGRDGDGLPEALTIIVVEDRAKHGARAEALAAGDRVLAALTAIGDLTYEAKPIRRLAKAPSRILGIFQKENPKNNLHHPDIVGYITPVDKKQRDAYAIRKDRLNGAKEGDLVWARKAGGTRSTNRLGLAEGEIIEVIGDADAPGGVSLTAIMMHHIPMDFPAEALSEAEAAAPVSPEGRTDLRALPLVTIDGADARDFDDAVFAEPSPEHGGWHLVVAIADVAHYVRPGSALDEAALERGNSVYFPDRVVPMLPERLSNGLCSLKPEEDRACLACHIWIGGDGEMVDYRFERAIMRSHARLTYEAAQSAVDGETGHGVPDAIRDTCLKPLYGAYAVLRQAREARGTLDLDIPEARVVLDEAGHVTGMEIAPRLDSHRLIEEFMIAANVAAATALDEPGRRGGVYRVHEPPDKARIAALSDILRGLDISLAKGQVIRPHHLTRVLEQIEGRDEQRMVHELVLRAQSQARYGTENMGHFGLALRRYTHFTSPIRRYADLMVHRALIDRFELGPDGNSSAITLQDADETAAHISDTERRAIAAERQANDRYAAKFLSSRVGDVFDARISGLTNAGIFVTVEPAGADGLIPIRTLPDDYYRHDPAAHTLTGQRWGRIFSLGQRLRVKLTAANPATGLVDFVLDGDDDDLPRSLRGQNGPQPGRGKKSPGKPARGRKSGAKSGSTSRTKKQRR